MDLIKIIKDYKFLIILLIIIIIYIYYKKKSKKVLVKKRIKKIKKEKFTNNSDNIEFNSNIELIQNHALHILNETNKLKHISMEIITKSEEEKEVVAGEDTAAARIAEEKAAEEANRAAAETAEEEATEEANRAAAEEEATEEANRAAEAKEAADNELMEKRKEIERYINGRKTFNFKEFYHQNTPFVFNKNIVLNKNRVINKQFFFDRIKNKISNILGINVKDNKYLDDFVNNYLSFILTQKFRLIIEYRYYKLNMRINVTDNEIKIIDDKNFQISQIRDDNTKFIKDIGYKNLSIKDYLFIGFRKR